MKFVLKRYWKIWIQGNVLPKLSRNSKIKSRDATSRRIYPDGRTRGGHARKRVARDHSLAAKTRPKPRFRGNTVESGDKFFFGESYWDSTSFYTYKYPCRATEKGVQRITGPNLGFLGQIVTQFLFFFCNLYFFFKRERPMLRVTPMYPLPFFHCFKQ